VSIDLMIEKTLVANFWSLLVAIMAIENGNQIFFNHLCW
jgi:hypothetical protein